VIYYLQDTSTLDVKIGYSKDVKRRVSQIQAQNNPNRPYKLLCVEEGGLVKERVIHKEFSHLRIGGEWFRFGEDLERRINYNAPDDDVDWFHRGKLVLDGAPTTYRGKTSRSALWFSKGVCERLTGYIIAAVFGSSFSRMDNHMRLAFDKNPTTWFWACRVAAPANKGRDDREYIESEWRLRIKYMCSLDKYLPEYGSEAHFILAKYSGWLDRQRKEGMEREMYRQAHSRLAGIKHFELDQISLDLIHPEDQPEGGRGRDQGR